MTHLCKIKVVFNLVFFLNLLHILEAKMCYYLVLLRQSHTVTETGKIGLDDL